MVWSWFQKLFWNQGCDVVKKNMVSIPIVRKITWNWGRGVVSNLASLSVKYVCIVYYQTMPFPMPILQQCQMCALFLPSTTSPCQDQYMCKIGIACLHKRHCSNNANNAHYATIWILAYLALWYYLWGNADFTNANCATIIGISGIVLLPVGLRRLNQCPLCNYLDIGIFGIVVLPLGKRRFHQCQLCNHHWHTGP